MPLTDTLAPKCIISAFWKNRIRIQAVQREHSRVPAHRDNADMTALLRSGIHFFKMLWNARMGVKAVNHIKMLHIRRCLCRKICRAAAAENHHVDLVLPRLHLRILHTFAVFVKIETVSGSLRVNTAASSRSSFCRTAHSTPRPRLPYPNIPIRILIFSLLISTLCLYPYTQFFQSVSFPLSECGLPLCLVQSHDSFYNCSICCMSAGSFANSSNT